VRAADLFRVAQPAPRWLNLTKTLLQTTVFWTLLLLIVPAWIVRLTAGVEVPGARFAPMPLTAAVLFAGFGFLGLTCGFTLASLGEGTPLPLDAPRRLVVKGPYAWVRNPMAIAGLGQGVAVGLWFGSAWVIAYSVAGGLIWNFLVRPIEERYMLGEFGPEYEAYRLALRCWIPSVPPGPRA
jgi:protein-S-isoprenylcysteine O-methyltransferase Ste14